MSLQTRRDYDNLVWGFRPAWMVDIRGFRDHQHMLDSFKEHLHAHHEWDEPTTEPVAGSIRGALSLHGLGEASFEDDYSEESMP
jgi:hypothetical protein